MIQHPSLQDRLLALPDLGDPYADERAAVERLLALAPTEAVRDAARRRALRFVDHVRGTDAGWLSAQSLLASFPLASAEGVALLRLAEALLRVPDPETQTWLIAEKLASFRDARAGGGDALVQRVLATALRIAGHTAGEAELNAGADASALRGWLARTTLRPLVIEGIRRFGEQFVFAQTLETAVARASGRRAVTEVHSYDMLGEGARSAADAQRNLDAYAQAIATLARAAQPGPWQARDGISVKLSAIHPRFETLQLERVHEELYPRLLALAQAAQAADINFTIDAEESERLVLQIALLDRLLAEPSLRDWEGLGLALQAYMPRALATVEHLLARAKETGRALAIRVVKGAYWDAEIKRAQELGMPGFPVYTRKWATDLSYLAIAQRLLLHSEAPQVPVRVYAPVGSFRDLLAYLVRRLLENGANSSFVHQISDPGVAPAALVDDPVDLARRALGQGARLPALPTGAELFGNRANSRGLDVQHPPTLLRLLAAVPPAVAAGATAVRNPARLVEVVGGVDEADAERAAHSVAGACAAFAAWERRPVAERAALLQRAADAMEAQHDRLVALLQREAGKTLLDAHLEVREAIDFLRYYAVEAIALAPRTLPGPAGESNMLRLAGRGVFVCISPWNFPLAIFVGQVAAALVMGNAVIAKPAEQTPLVAQAAARLLHEAGVPPTVLQCLPGRGETVGAALSSDARICGVAFTGSTATARAINRALAARDAPIGVLIAETGGQNAMVVDSTALPEQVTDAVIASAFRSTGQRCSALRVLLVQEEIADGLLEMIAGAMRELAIGDPRDPCTDVGPVIDAAQLAALNAHRDWLRANATQIHECELPAGLAEQGHFFAPVAYELRSLSELAQEHFGPILHVVRFDKQRFDAVLAQINATGYGLTCGLHTRLDARVEQVAATVRAGNLYVNRNMIGAVVGVQPFGGEGLSGTGPKAGGPHYLLRFATERTVTINTAAAGGNVELAAAQP